MMESKGVPVVLCFNKEDSACEEQIAEIESIYRDCGYPCVFTSAKEEKNIEEIRKLLQGKTTVVRGPSGVSKSSPLIFTARIYGDRASVESIERGKHNKTF